MRRSTNISRFEEQLGYWRTKYPTDFIYDDENRPTSLRYSGTVNRTDYVYDAMGRITSRNAVLNNASYLSRYGYESGGYGANSTSPLVSSITQSGHNLNYAYDDNGNITSAVYKGQTIGYVYDALGQLVRVNDQVNNESWTYDYDRGGNILGKKRYSYTTGTLGTANYTEDYQYGDANWKDKLTARVINGVSYPVVSDAIGNITSYAGWTYAWQAGRQLTSQTNSGGTVEYKYNADGLRVQKKRGSTVTDYVLSGNNIVHMTVTGGHTLHFYYDGQNRPAQVQYNGTMYRYVHNLQGDIIAILDSAGNTVVQYAYDAWGGKKAITGSMAGTLGYYNPFRYRGYVWDEETWMYYLRSRYYYPELQRFISADTWLGKRGGLLSHNIFAYCLNTPQNGSDPSGNSILAGIGAFFNSIGELFSAGMAAQGSYAIAKSKMDYKLSISLASNIGLSSMKYPLANSLFHHFLWGEGKELSKESKDALGKELSKSVTLAKQILSDYNPNEPTIISTVEFKNGDLHYAIQKADYKAIITDHGDRLSALVFLSDIYNFDEEREGDSLSVQANNLGYKLQREGYGHPFSVNVSFAMDIAK